MQAQCGVRCVVVVTNSRQNCNKHISQFSLLLQHYLVLKAPKAKVVEPRGTLLVLSGNWEKCHPQVVWVVNSIWKQSLFHYGIFSNYKMPVKKFQIIGMMKIPSKWCKYYFWHRGGAVLSSSSAGKIAPNTFHSSSLQHHLEHQRQK